MARLVLYILCMLVAGASARILWMNLAPDNVASVVALAVACVGIIAAIYVVVAVILFPKPERWWVSVNIDSYVDITNGPAWERIAWVHDTKEEAIAYATKLRLMGIKVDRVHKMFGWNAGKNVLGVVEKKFRIPLLERAYGYASRLFARGGRTKSGRAVRP